MLTSKSLMNWLHERVLLGLNDTFLLSSEKACKQTFRWTLQCTHISKPRSSQSVCRKGSRSSVEGAASWKAGTKSCQRKTQGEFFTFALKDQILQLTRTLRWGFCNSCRVKRELEESTQMLQLYERRVILPRDLHYLSLRESGKHPSCKAICIFKAYTK